VWVEEELRVYRRYIDFVVLGTTWSASRQAGRQARQAGRQASNLASSSRHRGTVRAGSFEGETRTGDGREGERALTVCMVLGLAVAAMRVVSE